VVTIREPKPHEQTACRLRTERVDQLLSQETHRRRAEDDDALLVEPDDALVGPEVQELGELQATVIHLFTILLRTEGVQCGIRVKQPIAAATAPRFR
jgi:hypothetical protein